MRELIIIFLFSSCSSLISCIVVFGDKGAPFVFVSLTMPPADVDVNVHPTKEKVALLEEKTIVAILKVLT